MVKSDYEDGNAVNAEVQNFCQLEIGQINLTVGKSYRVSADVSARGAHTVELGVRLTPSPYRLHGKLVTQVFESPRTLELYIPEVKLTPTNPVHVQLIMRGTTTLTIDNVKVEEIEKAPNLDNSAEGMMLADPAWPTGNIIANSGFEVGLDGYYRRGGKITVDESKDAFEGRNIATLAPKAMLTSSFFKLPLRRSTLFVCRAKAIDKNTQVSVHIGNYIRFLDANDGYTKKFTVKPEEGWKTLSFEWTPKIIIGQVLPYKEFYMSISSNNGVLLDGCEVRHVGLGMEPKDQPYKPRSANEFVLDVDAPCHVANEDEKVILTLTSSQPSATTKVYRFDAEDKLYDSFEMTTKNYTATKEIKPEIGAWRYTTSPTGNADHSSLTPPELIHGECTLLVPPKMPELALEDWHFGSHIRPNPELLKSNWKLGWKWTRMHDAAAYAKWSVFEEKEGEYKLSDGVKTLKNSAGHAIMGNIDWIPTWAPQVSSTAKKTTAYSSVRYDKATDETLPLLEKACEELAKQGKGLIDEYEFTNEPNLSQIDPAHFVKVQEAAIRGLRKGDPNAKVVALGGACPAETGWMYQCIKLGVAKNADAISVHAYGFVPSSQRNGPQPLIDYVKRVEAALEKAGTPNKKIYDTESGYIIRSNMTKFPNPTGNSSFMDTAQNLPKAVAAVLASGLDRWMYYASFTQSHPGDGGAYSVAEHDHSIKFPFQAMAVAISYLEGKEFISYKNEGDVVVLTFKGKNETVTMIWDTKGSASYNVPKNADKIISMWGMEMPKSDKITLSKSPIYLVTR